MFPHIPFPLRRRARRPDQTCASCASPVAADPAAIYFHSRSAVLCLPCGEAALFAPDDLVDAVDLPAVVDLVLFPARTVSLRKRATA